MDAKSKTERIVEARMKLKARFEGRMKATPALSDACPEGSGPPNRHGMPRVPVGQEVVEKWPVLDLGTVPEGTRETWRLRVDGACERAADLGWEDLLALEQVEDTSDFHCVTTWSRLDLTFVGVRLADVLALAGPLPEAAFLMCHAYDGYTTNMPLEEALKGDVLLAHRAEGAPLTREHGGPVRIVTPQLYAWKGAKWVERLELLTEDRLGFWELRGYSSTAHPWGKSAGQN